MDFLLNFLTFENLVLAFVGTIGIVGFVASLRAMRKDRLTYSSRHDAMEGRIRETEKSIRDHNKTMRSGEQLHIIAVSLKDALELKNHNAEDIIIEHADHIEIKLPGRTITVQHLSNTRQLQSINKTIHGQGFWEVYQSDTKLETFKTLQQLERYLLTELHGADF